jgi:hypothetical protein
MTPPGRTIQTLTFGRLVVPGCDHGVPSDVTWGNFIDNSRRLAETTGWL